MFVPSWPLQRSPLGTSRAMSQHDLLPADGGELDCRPADSNQHVAANAVGAAFCRATTCACPTRRNAATVQRPAFTT
jgi:hypothetical protein